MNTNTVICIVLLSISLALCNIVNFRQADKIEDLQARVQKLEQTL